MSISSFILRNLTEIEAITGCTFACTRNTVFRMFSCLQINCQPFYLRQLLKFHQFDWLIEIYLQTEGQGTHHKMVSLQPMSGFSPLFLDAIKYHMFTVCHWNWDWSSDVGFEASRRRFGVEARVRFALPISWLNLTGSQPRLCTYPGLALGRSSAAYTPGFSLLTDQSK